MGSAPFAGDNTAIGRRMNYPGGKGGCFRSIINEMPPHEVYIEPFLGGGNVMVNKLPSRRTIGIDADAGVVQQFAISHSHGWRGDIGDRDGMRSIIVKADDTAAA